MVQKRRPRPAPANGNAATTEGSISEKEATPVSTAKPSTSTATNSDAPNGLSACQQYTEFRRGRRTVRGRRSWMSVVDYLMVFIAFGVFMLFLMLVWEIFLPTYKQRVYACTVAVSLIPVVLAAFTALKPSKPLHERVSPVVFVSAILSRLFPTWFNAGVAALALFGLGWVSRPGIMVNGEDQDNNNNNALQSKESDEDGTDTKKKKPTNSTTSSSNSQQSKLTQAAGYAILMVVVMLTENFFIWVVSATFEKGQNPQTAPDPLQDNGRRILQALFGKLAFTKKEVVSLRRIWNVQYALVASLGVGLSLVDFHPTRQLWSLASRAILTMTSARFLRTISFLLTVLPSQNKFCYHQHYGPNPPPELWWDWIMMGMIPNSSGGCNDLIVSGHATVTATMACVSVSLANDVWFTLAVAWLLAMDYLVEVYEGFHYSVDMWMGAVLCGLLWRVWKPIEDNNTDRNLATLQDMMGRFQTESITVKDAILYGGPVLIAYLQVTVLPPFSTNFVIMGFTSYCIIQMVMNGFQHHTRHLLFCDLYIALGIYL